MIQFKFKHKKGFGRIQAEKIQAVIPGEIDDTKGNRFPSINFACDEDTVYRYEFFNYEDQEAVLKQWDDFIEEFRPMSRVEFLERRRNPLVAPPIQ